jgi:hypothetical protein
MLVEFVSVTFSREMLPITGAEMVEMRRRMDAAKMNKTPIQWSQRNMIAIF